MNKTAVIGIVIGIVVILAGAGYFLTSRESAPPTPSLPGSQETSENTKNASLLGLMNLVQNQKCTFADLDSASEGTVYVAGEKVRGDFTAVTTEGTMGSHVIITEDDMYVWTDSSDQGFRFAAGEPQENEGDYNQYSESAESPGVDVTKEVSYECTPWVVDNSKFNLPDNITFQDFSTVMQEVTESTVDELQIDCTVCDDLPAGESKQQCLQSLGCN